MKDNIWRILQCSGTVNPDKLWQPKPHHRLCTCYFSKPPNPNSITTGWNHVIPDMCKPESKREVVCASAKARSDRAEERSSKSTVQQSMTDVNYEVSQGKAPEFEPDQQPMPPECRHIRGYA